MLLINGVIRVSFSDHPVIYGVLKTRIPKAPPRIIEYRSFKRYSKNAFLSNLSNVDWGVIDYEPDIDAAVNIWNTFFTGVAHQHATIKLSRVKGTHMPWPTPDLRGSMQDCDFQSNPSHHITGECFAN